MKPRGVFVCAMAFCLAGFAFAQVEPADAWRQSMLKANQLDISGDYAGAASIFHEALNLAERSDDQRLATSLNALANTYDQLGRYSDSEPLFRRALTVSGKNGIWDATYALTVSNMGAHYVEAGQRDKAKSMLRESLAIFTRLLPDSLQLALNRNALATLILGDGEYDEAEKLVEAALVTFRKRRQAGPEELAIGLNNLGVVRMKQNKPEQAEQLFEESIHLVEAELSPDHPILLRGLANLGSV
jgi:tetratricopeptide (TPR) repeat protein